MAELSRRTAILTAAAAAALPAPALARARWDRDGLGAVRAEARALEVKGLVVLSGGKTVVSDGDVTAADRIASCRKSFLSALYGMAVRDSRIDLDLTLKDVGIDDYQPLTPVELKATVRDLLQARSGVYIPSSAETPAMKAARPARGSHPPGTFWYYNNWDFNVLAEIYQRLTGLSFFTAFEHYLARPLGFQDYDPLKHGRFAYDANAPRFAAYNLWLSARDMAKFGQLFLQEGRWQGREIVPQAWVAESTRVVSRAGGSGILSGYGYMWWADADPAASGLPPGSYAAAGNGGRYIAVMPAIDTVVAIQSWEREGQPQAKLYTQAGALDGLLKRLVAARRL
ncbi:MAG: serine hydrolase [Phenylobacterium sp.]|uniref:serine hydrolase domain-containing protein n=1 Tax=Phenylobacterium sp. TaxID=1871053 RepID=UPI001A51A154|nr:serine hydrolase [Phenylobacterium sp.]MBL8554335.1 serine hydrolase [Phenylobacterium sp.]